LPVEKPAPPVTSPARHDFIRGAEYFN